jgi:hypothetical protein
VTRPALTVYYGREAMAGMLADISAAYGSHRLEVLSVAEEPAPQAPLATSGA